MSWKIVPFIIWVVLCLSYNHICGIFGNVMAEVWLQYKLVQCMNLKYKIYFHHKTENSIIIECFDYSVFPTHVNILWHCRSMQAATFSHRTRECNVEREKWEAKLILQLKIYYELFSCCTINVFCCVQCCYTLLSHTFSPLMWDN